MFASYRIEVSPSLYGSEGSLTINNTLQLPDSEMSLYGFKTALLRSVEQILPKVWKAYLDNQALKESLEKRLSEEASLFESEPPDFGAESTEKIFTEIMDEEWQERYSRNF